MASTPVAPSLPLPSGLVRHRLSGYAAALLGPVLVAAVSLPLRPHFNDTTVALAMVLVVLLVAVRWGSRPAMLASLCGLLLFDFLFLPQGGIPALRDSESWVALAAFLITAATAGELSVRARRRASAYNRSLIEASLDPLVTIGQDGRITDVNLATETITGRSRRRLIGTDFSEYFTEPQRARAGYEQVFRDRLVHNYPLEVRHRDGRTIPVLYNASVYRDENGAIAGVFAAARDISERRRAENEIRSLARLQAAAAELGQIALRGAGPAEVLDQAVVLVAHTLAVDCCEVLEQLADSRELLLRAGVGWQEGCLGRARVAGGTGSPAGYALSSRSPAVFEDLASEPRFHASPLLRDHAVVSGVTVVISTNEGPYGVLGAHTRQRRAFTADEVQFLQSVATVLGMMIERSRVEKALRESGINLSKAQEIAHLGSWHLDLAHNRLSWSDEVFRIFGVPPGSALTYEAFLGLVHPDDRQSVDRAWHAALAGDPYDIEHRIAAAGGLKWVRERAKVEFGDDGRPLEGNGTVQDITERKQAEAEIRALNADLEARVKARTAELEAANRLKDEMIRRAQAAGAEAAQAREREVELGFRIQQTLLLEPPPENFPGLRMAALTIPSQRIDGDFYLFLPHQAQSLDVMIGDVMGKGSPAALLGAATKAHFLKAFSHLVASARDGRLPQPHEIVMLAHAQLARHLIDLDSFVTLCYARFDMEHCRLELIDCGHTGLIHRHGRDGRCDAVHGDNLPLGIREGEIYNQVAVAFEPGDLFLFYSDGITEARNPAGELFGPGRLEDCVRAHPQLDPAALVDAVHRTVRAFSATERLADDLTAVAVAVEEREMPLRRAAAEIASDLRQLRDARRFVRSFCAALPGEPLDADAAAALELAVNEAASNIIKHAYGGSAGHVIQLEGEAFPGRIAIRLHHYGPPFEPPPARLPPAGEPGESGFGIYLMAASVDEVRYHRDAGGRNCISLTKLRGPAEGRGQPWK